jgi:hypothetical protein
MFYVSGVTSSTGNRDIADFFVDFTPIEIKWIDQNGLIVIVNDPIKAKTVLPTLQNQKAPKFKVIPYQEYRDQLVGASKGAKQDTTWLLLSSATALSAAALMHWYYKK